MDLSGGGAPQDEEIIGRVLEGDVNAFEVLVERYRSLVFAIVLKHVPAEQAEETAQDAFVEAFRSLGTFSARAPFRYWLSRITARCCYNFWRERKGNLETPVSTLSEDSGRWMDDVLGADSREAFERETEKREAAEILRIALAGLSAEDRMVVTLVHLEGLPVKEAAALLGWSVVSVKVRAHRSRRKLREIVSKLMDERHAQAGG